MNRLAKTHVIRWLTLGLALLLAFPLLPTPALAIGTTIQVDPTANDKDDANDGKCSIREALQAISQSINYNGCNASGSAPYTIKFTSVGTIKINTGNALPDVSKMVLITGPVIIDGNGSAIFRVSTNNGNLTLTNMTLTKARRAVFVQNDGKLNVAGVSFLSNGSSTDSELGSGIASFGAVNIAGSVFTANQTTADGGAIYMGGSSDLNIAGTIFNGNVAKWRGGAIYMGGAGNATFTDLIFNGNIAKGEDPNNNGTDNDPADDYDSMGGGAVFYGANGGDDPSTMTITRGIFNGNLTPKGQGGALYIQTVSDDLVIIRDSALNGNIAGTPPSTKRRGGAIYNLGRLNLEHSTLLNNAVAGDGGAIANDRSANLNISNVTVVANAATDRGAGLFNFNTQSGSSIRPFAKVINVTFSKNAALSEGGNIYGQDPTSTHPDVVQLNNTIVEGSDGGGLGGNCAGTGVQSLGHNLDSGTSCNLNQTGDKSSANANLDAPKFNGGPLPTLLTMKLLGGSAAADAGDNAVCAAAPVNNKDQTNAGRPKGAACDMGAYEAEAPQSSFGMTPLPPGPLDLGNTQVNTQGQIKSYELKNVGSAPLTLSNGQKGGADASQFNVATGFPFDIAPGGTSTLDVQCVPTGNPGPRSATLSFTTNDPARPSVTFDLKCNATAAPTPGYSSIPVAPGPLSFGDVLVGTSKNLVLKIQESGNASLAVNTPVLSGANPGDFSFGAGVDLNLPDGEAPFNLSLSCTPTAPGLRSAVFTLNTSDPIKPQVSYTLTCEGDVPVPPPFEAVGDSADTPDASASLYGLAVSPDGKHIYAADNGVGRVISYRFSNGNFVRFAANTSSVIAGARNVVVSADGQNVYVTGFNGDAVAMYDRNPDSGFLSLVEDVTNGDTVGCLPIIGNGLSGLDGAWGLALSPDGRHMYVSGINDDAIVVLNRNQETGSLKRTFGSPCLVGTRPAFVESVTQADMDGPTGITISPDGLYLYVAANNSNKLLVFKRDANTGKLTYVETKSNGFSGGLIRSAISPDGNYLYAAADTSDALIIFQRNSTTGKLSEVASLLNSASWNLDGASSVASDSDGRYLAVTAFTGDEITIFERKASTGGLKKVQAIRKPQNGPEPNINGPRQVVFSPDGRKLFVTSTNTDLVYAFELANPTPAITSLAPASAPAGSGNITLEVNGEGFVPGSVVRWNATDSLPTTFVNANKLEATVSAALLANAGSRGIQVLNPTPGGGGSNGLNFTITAPAENPVPSLSELLPAGVVAGAADLTLTVKGANFMPSSKALWNGSERSTVFINSSTLQIQVAAADLAQPGDMAVTITNPTPGGGPSNALGFVVAAPGVKPPPAINSIAPASINAIDNAGAVLTVVIKGSNFVEDSQAQWNGENRPTTFVNANEIHLAVNGGDTLEPGQASVRVVNPDDQSSNTVSFTIGAPGDNPLPASTGYSVTAVGGGVWRVTVNGSGFIAGTQGQWNGANRPTTVVNTSQLTFDLTPADVAAGSGVATFVNPAPGGGPSDELLITLPRRFIPLSLR
jgi:predicted outer membrane repeat protein